MPSIGLLGDVMLGRGVADALGERSPTELWSGELRRLCSSLDLLICNLECCISERGEPTRRIPGKPFFFRGPPVAVDVLDAIGVRAVSLANNHALDYETDALADTLKLLDAAAIVAVGAGRGQELARRPAVVEAGGVRIGLVSVSDHPAAYAAGAETYGIAHADLSRGAADWLLDAVASLRGHCEWVIAFPHWGPNMAPEPGPWQLRCAAELQDAGADLVAGHSAHLFHGVAWTSAGPVLTDLGDALDDYRIDPVLRNDLGLLAIWEPDDGRARLELAGLKLDYCHTGLADGPDAEWIAGRLERASAKLGAGVERIDRARFRISP